MFFQCAHCREKHPSLQIVTFEHLFGKMSDNLQVALNVAPLLSKSLNMQQRLECAVSGFVCLDIFSLLASYRCSQLHLPTGSCFMAAQTVVNLQACALAAVVITVTKHESMSLWWHGDMFCLRCPTHVSRSSLSSSSSGSWDNKLRLPSLVVVATGRPVPDTRCGCQNNWTRKRWDLVERPRCLMKSCLPEWEGMTRLCFNHRYVPLVEALLGYQVDAGLMSIL